MKKIFKFFTISSLLVLIVSISLVKTKAASDMRVLCPSDVQYIGHSFNITAQFNTDGQDIDTVSLHKLQYRSNNIEATGYSVINVLPDQSELPSNGIEHDPANDQYGYVNIEVAKGLTSPNYSNTTYESFATITFLPHATDGTCTSQNGQLTCTRDMVIQYDGTPSYSGIFLGGTNYLDGVTNCTVTLQEDETPPVWGTCSPGPGDTNISVVSNVSCDVTDDQTNIYLNDTTLRLQDVFNDTTFHYSTSPTYSTSAITNGYTITADPSYQFPYDADITVRGRAYDNAYDNGNLNNSGTYPYYEDPIWNPNYSDLTAFTFHTEDDTDAPSLYNLDPSRGQTNVPVNTNIAFNVHDVSSTGGYAGIGVDINSISVRVVADGWGDVTYTTSSPELSYTAIATNTPYGNVYDYRVVIDPASDFPQNVDVHVYVEVDDLHSPSPNHLSDSYVFTTIDTTPPYCELFSPEPHSIGMNNSSDIVFHCKDTGTGVDIDSVEVLLDGKVYRRTGTYQFSYTGDASDYEITIDPDSDFASNYAFEVVIDLQDNNNNSNRYSYGLGTQIDGCPVCTECTTCTECPTTTACPTSDDSGSCTPETEYVTVYQEVQVCDEACCSDQDQCNCDNGDGSGSGGSGSGGQEDCSCVLGDDPGSDPGTVEETEVVQINNKDYDLTMGYVEVYKDFIKVSGISKPNSHLVIVVYSDPIVFTTDTDSEGHWTVYMSNRLPLGQHDIYAAVSDGGTIESKKKIAQIFVKDNADLNVLIDTSREVSKQVIDNYITEDGSNAIAMSSSVVGLLGPVMSVLASLLAMLRTLGQDSLARIFARLLQTIGLLPRGKPQGIVFDTTTYRGVPFAIIEIYKVFGPGNSKSEFVEKLITDKDGTYSGINLPRGNYKFVVKAKGYRFPTVKQRTQYMRLQDFYKGEIVSVTETKDKEFLSIPVDRISKDAVKESIFSKIHFNIIMFMRRFSFITTALFIFSALLLFANPTPLNWAFFIIYLLMQTKIVSEKLRKPTIAGVIVDGQGNPIPNVIVKLSIPGQNELVAISTTDKNGQFKFYVKKNIYTLFVLKEGYTTVNGPMSLMQINAKKKKQFVILPLTRV